MCVSSSELQSERLLADTACVLQPKDWSIRMNKKERRLAMGTALQSANANITIVEDLKVIFDKNHIELQILGCLCLQRLSSSFLMA